MSQHDQQQGTPDLDETIHVAEAHASDATSRETTIAEGNKAVPMWIYGIAMVAALGAGAIFGKAGNFFNYTGQFKSGYIRGLNPNPPAADKPPVTAMAAYSRTGEKVYAKCTGCHQANGAGVAGAFPPLSGSEWVIEDNTTALSMIIYNGVKGPLMVKGELWNHNMAAQGSGLGPKELAGLMTYIRNNLGNETGDIVTLEMAKNALAKIDERGEGTQMSQDELKAKWMTKLEGETLDPNTMVDPETWEPVEQ